MNNINFKQYIEDATTTESVLAPDHKANVQALIFALVSVIGTGNAIDLLKKNMFYGKPIDQDALENHIAVTHGGIEEMRNRLSEAKAVLEPLPIDGRVIHGIVGILTESTELCEALVKHVIGVKPFDVVNVREELGDLFWYMAILFDALGIDLKETLDINIAKLKKRYGDKFSAKSAIERDLDGERQILEGN